MSSNGRLRLGHDSGQPRTNSLISTCATGIRLIKDDRGGVGSKGARELLPNGGIQHAVYVPVLVYMGRRLHIFSLVHNRLILHRAVGNHADHKTCNLPERCPSG